MFDNIPVSASLLKAMLSTCLAKARGPLVSQLSVAYMWSRNATSRLITITNWRQTSPVIDMLLGCGAGVTVSAANILQFLGGQAAGYAASDLVQANPIVATIWGIWFFKEYRKSSKEAYTFLVLMYLLYIAAVVLLAVSASTRSVQ